MAELAYALGLGSSAARLVGSSPTVRILLWGLCPHSPRAQAEFDFVRLSSRNRGAWASPILCANTPWRPGYSGRQCAIKGRGRSSISSARAPEIVAHGLRPFYAPPFPLAVNCSPALLSTGRPSCLILLRRTRCSPRAPGLLRETVCDKRTHASFDQATATFEGKRLRTRRTPMTLQLFWQVLVT